MSMNKMSYKLHPWHGLELGEKSPDQVSCYIEMVPTDNVKYELDKKSGILRVDRPQQYSSYCPSLYGLLPRTYCGKRVGKYCGDKIGVPEIQGDADPLDICVLAEKAIVRGDIIVQAIPIGGLRLIDGEQADDKIIAVLAGDYLYGDLRDIKECSCNMLDRLRHYFLTYKDHPGEEGERQIQITHVYGREEAHEVIRLSALDYEESTSEVLGHCFDSVVGSTDDTC